MISFKFSSFELQIPMKCRDWNLENDITLLRIQLYIIFKINLRKLETLDDEYIS